MSKPYLIPEYLIVICNFFYTKETRSLPNDLRRFLMGLSQQDTRKEGKKKPGLPEKINKNGKVLFPEYFSLIKNPIYYGEQITGRKKLSMRARGAIAVYTILTSTEEDTIDLVKKIYGEIYKWMDKRYKKGYGLSFSHDDLTIILGEKIDIQK